MAAQDPTLLIHNLALLGPAEAFTKEFGKSPLRDETYILALWLGRDGDPHPRGYRADLYLRQVTEGKQNRIQIGRLLGHQEIGLVFGAIASFSEPWGLAATPAAGIVTGGQGLAPQGHRPIEKQTKLDSTVAEYARVRGEAAPVRFKKRAYDTRFELVVSVKNKERDPQMPGHSAGIGNIFHGTTTGGVPHLQGEPHHLVTFLGE
jgi:hypothetical protein